MTNFETDYLVVGAGASSMSFVDSMLISSDATFTIVDRRMAPGGHWIDAYPFVRLHQPSAFYGVPSRELGLGQIETDGFNKGLYELATGPEVAAYFSAVMRETFLPSGRVRYFPMSEYQGDGRFANLLSGESFDVEIRKKLVDGTILQTEIPLTHRPNFQVAPEVAITPPNHLPRIAPGHGHYAVLGGGKTAIDAILWLLENGVAPDSVSWVLPRDSWFLNRAKIQPGMAFFEATIGGTANQFEICATAKTVEELCLRMEAQKIWLRLDDTIWPTMFHAATITEPELNALQSLPNKIRQGRIQEIAPERMVLDGGVVKTGPGTLFVDCTARALAHNVMNDTPIFSDGRITLQMLRAYQPTFSAAMIGRIEATISSEAEKAAYMLPTPMTDRMEDWLQVYANTLKNGGAWGQNAELQVWASSSRLNAIGRAIAKVNPGDSAKMAIVDRLGEFSFPAVANLTRLIGQH